MKKYILLLVSVFSFGQASNQMVTFTQAQSLGYTLNSGQSHTLTDKCMTKSEALAKYNLNASAMSSYASNQLVPKSVLMNVSNYYTYQISAGGCSDQIETINLYSSSASIAVGMVFYTNTSLTNTYSGRSLDRFYPNGNQLLAINDSGVLVAVDNCSASFYTSDFASSTIQASESCTLLTVNNYYSSLNYPVVGSVLYTNTALTMPLVGNNRWFYNDAYAVSFRVDSSGIIIEQFACN